MEEAYVGRAGSSNAVAKKERSSYAGAGSTTKADKKRALLMLKNLKLDEEKAAQAGSKTEKKVLENPVPDEFPLLFEPLPGQVEGGRQSKALWGRNRKRRKETHRLGKEYIDYVEKNPLPPLYLPDPRFSDVFMDEIEEGFVAKQMADYEERDMIIKQIKEFGYADVEVEVPDYDEGPFCKDVSFDGYWYGVKAG